MAISDGYKSNFETLLAAAQEGDLTLLECVDRKTGVPVTTICAVEKLPGEQFRFVPLAKLFSGDPYKELMAPAEVDSLKPLGGLKPLNDRDEDEDESLWHVRLTRDATESTTVAVYGSSCREANQRAQDLAGEYGENIDTWQLDDCNDHEVYLPDPDSTEEFKES